jgi:hypothetical protein
MRCVVAAVALASVATWLAPPSLAAAPTDVEVKAALVFKIAKFVAWPPPVEADDDKLTLCHLASREAARAFATLEGESVGGRTIAVSPVISDDDASACEVLFISAGEEPNAAQMLRRVAARPVLTIGESSTFATRLGGVMTLRTDTRRVRFEVNLAASRRAGLQINSQLLQLATIVDEQAIAGGARR